MVLCFLVGCCGISKVKVNDVEVIVVVRMNIVIGDISYKRFSSIGRNIVVMWLMVKVIVVVGVMLFGFVIF